MLAVSVPSPAYWLLAATVSQALSLSLSKVLLLSVLPKLRVRFAARSHQNNLVLFLD
jgi:hypothetical protein